MDRTAQAVQKMLSAMAVESCEVGILNDKGMMLRAVASGKVISLLPLLKRENANGSHIYIRPRGEHNLTLLDDLTREKVARLFRDGFEPSAVVETSPGNFQAWLKHSRVLPQRLSTFAAKTLAERFGGDPSSADWRHFGRLPGLTNRKRKYVRPNGHYPFVLLHEARTEPYRMADFFFLEITNQFQLLEEQREEAKRSRAATLSHAQRGRCPPRSVLHFRNLAKYNNQPAQADMAFAVFQLSIGVPEAEIAADLDTNYLSSDPNPARRESYIERTLDKARSYVQN